MSIYKKLFEAKKEIGAITKDAKNPFFKSSYFDINGLLKEVEPILQKNGLVLLQPIKDGKVITEIIDIDGKDGEVCIVDSEMTLPNIQDPQKLGSAITYYRRYTLQSLLGLQAEDDDGNKAAKKEPVKIDLERLKNRLEACETMEALATAFKALNKEEQKAGFATKEAMKVKLSIDNLKS